MRRLTVLSTVVLLILAGTACRGSRGRQPTTTVTITADDTSGQPLSAEGLERARAALQQRIEKHGTAAKSQVRDDRIVLTLTGRYRQEQLNWLVVPGVLRFRKVIEQAVSTSAPASSGPPATTSGRLPSRDDVFRKLGPAADIAAQLPSGPPATTEDPRLAPFGTLTGPEVAVLPPELQFRVPQVSCALLSGRPLGSTSDSAAAATACTTTGDIKYLLDVAKVGSGDVAKAASSIDPNGQWLVTLTFTAEGQSRWTALTQEASTNAGGGCAEDTLSGGVCLVAIVVDDRVVSAPAVQSVIDGDAVITGSFTRDSAAELASQLTLGLIASRLTIESVTIVD